MSGNVADARLYLMIVARLSESRDTGIDVKLLHDLADKVCVLRAACHTIHVSRPAPHVNSRILHIMPSTVVNGQTMCLSPRHSAVV